MTHGFLPLQFSLPTHHSIFSLQAVVFKLTYALTTEFQRIRCLWSGLYLNHIEILQVKELLNISIARRMAIYDFRNISRFVLYFNLGSSGNSLYTLSRIVSPVSSLPVGAFHCPVILNIGSVLPSALSVKASPNQGGSTSEVSFSAHNFFSKN